MTSRTPRTRLIVLALAVAVSALVLVSGCAATNATSNTAGGGHAAATSSDSQSPAAATTDQSQTSESTAPKEDAVYTPSYKPNGQEVAVIKTAKGTIRFKFYSADAPNHVAAFIELAKKGFYDGTKFHRVVPDFVVQGGDPLSRNDDPMVGTGGPGYRLKAEFNKQKHLDGTVAMARSQDPDSAGSQFYICLGAQPMLDGQYTAFGQVTEGMDVVRSIQVGDVMESVTIENAD